MTPEQQKFLIKLLDFEYGIVYRPGKEKKVGDALTRREGSQLLEAIVVVEEASSSTLNGVKWRVWDKI